MQTIIHNSFILQYYTYKNIDQKILELFDNSSTDKTKINFIKRALNVYLNITSQRLSFIELSSDKFKKIIDDLYLFLNVDYFNLSNETLRTYKQQLQKCISYFKIQIPNLNNYDININHTKFNFKIDNSKIDYFNGWFLTSKNNKQKIFINLICFYDILGKDKVGIIHKNVQQYISRFELDTSKSFLSMLNDFSIFLNNKDLEELRKNIYNENYLFNLLKDFCFNFFQNEQNNSRCMHNSKKKWNKFIVVFDEVFLNNEVLPKLNSPLPKAPNHDKKGFERRIKFNNGSQVKSKLITDIPLNITDEVAIDILFKKIKSDVQLTLDWANSRVEQLNKNYNKDLAINCFGKTVAQIQKELNRRTTIEKLKEGFITSYDLDPFMFILISEHPQITDSYLLNFELYNESNNLSGYIKIDESYYLIGYKKRRGSELAEQKILLTSKTKDIIENIILLTKDYREYLKSKSDDSWRYLFLNGGSNGIEPQKHKKSFVPAPSNLRIKEGQKRIEFFKNYINCSNEEATKFVSNMTMTRLRASIAVQLYLEQNDTKKMAEALGHKKYKPELLSFYLPETILDFFQSRWIRIFQKGIICEAMKDSSNFFNASKFNSMEELDEFMNLHSLKNIPDVQKYNNIETNKDELYIGVNEEILNVLLSLEKAVELAEEDVSSKALYWSRFSNKLQNEIINNKSNIQFIKDLEKARKNINIKLFEEVIYEK